MFAGIVGTGNDSTSYTENVGAIGITDVTSRYVVQIGAVVMIVVGYVGLSQLQHVDMNQNRNVFVTEFGLFASLSIPQYIANVQAAPEVSLEPRLTSVPVLGISDVANTISIVLGTEIAVDGIAAFVLDNPIPGTREERGLTAWEDIPEDADTFVPLHEKVLSGGTLGEPQMSDD